MSHLLWVQCNGRDPRHGTQCQQRFLRWWFRPARCPACSKRESEIEQLRIKFAMRSPRQEETPECANFAPSEQCLHPVGSLERPLRCRGEAGFRKYLAKYRGSQGEALEAIPVELDPSQSANLSATVRTYRVCAAGATSLPVVFVDLGASEAFDCAPLPGLVPLSEFLRKKPFQDPAYFRQGVAGDRSDFPDLYGYIWSKCGSLLSSGPFVYAEDDYFSLPRPDFDHGALRRLAEQVVHEKAGAFPEFPLHTTDLERVAQFMATLHFKLTRVSVIKTGSDRGVYMIACTHVMQHDHLSLYFALDIEPPAAATEPYRHAGTGIMFPAELGGLQRAPDVTDYESDHPGLGVSIAYDGCAAVGTVYLYSAGRESVPEDPRSQVIRDEFEKALMDVRRAAAAHGQPDLTVLDIGSATWGQQPRSLTSLSATLTQVTTEHGAREVTHLHLIGFRNHFIKVRISHAEEPASSSGAIQREFMSALCDAVFGGDSR